MPGTTVALSPESPTTALHHGHVHCGSTRLMPGSKVSGRKGQLVLLPLLQFEKWMFVTESFRNFNEMVFTYGPLLHRNNIALRVRVGMKLNESH